MIAKTSTIASLLCLAAPLLSAVSAQQLVWSDEFDYGLPGGIVNPDIWTHDIGAWGWGNKELQRYTPPRDKNVQVKDGKLYITAMKDGNGMITSGRIKTLNKLTFKYGRLEASIKMPNLANGLWPAFWTLGNNFPDVSWPMCGELDVMEMGNGGGIGAGVINKRVGSASHWDNGGNYNTRYQYYDSPVNMYEDFHNYTMVWTPEHAITYVDGNQVWYFDLRDGSCPNCSEFHEHHFILLNLAVGGTYTGLMNSWDISAPMPAEYVIDYVRIYANRWTEVGGTGYNAPPPQAVTAPIQGKTLDQVDCGCPSTCTDAVLDQKAFRPNEDVTCRARIIFLQQYRGMDELDACGLVAGQFEHCGNGCMPGSCDNDKVVDCGCPASCTADILNQPATSWGNTYTCRARMNYLMSDHGYTQTDACSRVSDEFESLCGMGCDPKKCS